MHLALVCFCFEADARQVFANPFANSWRREFLANHEASKSHRVNVMEVRVKRKPDSPVEDAMKLASSRANSKARREAIQRGESEATHFGIVEFYGCFLFLNVLAFYGCLKYLLASMS